MCMFCRRSGDGYKTTSNGFVRRRVVRSSVNLSIGKYLLACWEPVGTVWMFFLLVVVLSDTEGNRAQEVCPRIVFVLTEGRGRPPKSTVWFVPDVQEGRHSEGIVHHESFMACGMPYLCV